MLFEAHGDGRRVRTRHQASRRVAQIAALQGRRAQVPDRAPRLGQGFTGHALRQIEMLGRLRIGDRLCHLRSAQLHHDAGQPLRQRVMNIARQPGALLQRRGFAGLFQQRGRLRLHA